MGDGGGEVLVIGGGVIGLSVAWQLTSEGAAVTVLDPAPGSGASRAAAGMLAPVTEAHYGEEELLALNLESAATWPGFAVRLERESGEEIGYDPSGTLAVAFDASDREALEELHRFQSSLGLPSRPLGASACRELEPALAPGIRGGLDVPGDHQVDPRRLAAALLSACEAGGVTFRREAVSSLLCEKGRFRGAATEAGEHCYADRGVLAAGWQSGLIAGLPEGLRPPVRPVKGQILRLRLDPRLPRPTRTIRALVRGFSVYLVPRRDGELVCGATVEELGPDTRVTAGPVYSLLRDAQAVLPSLYEAELVDAVAGLRPGSPDNAPLIGPSGLPGLVFATGHYRNGILLAPLTGRIICELLRGGDEEAWSEWPAFDPRRFSSKASPLR